MSRDKAGGMATGPVDKGFRESRKMKPVPKQCEGINSQNLALTLSPIRFSGTFGTGYQRHLGIVILYRATYIQPPAQTTRPMISRSFSCSFGTIMSR